MDNISAHIHAWEALSSVSAILNLCSSQNRAPSAAPARWRASQWYMGSGWELYLHTVVCLAHLGLTFP